MPNSLSTHGPFSDISEAEVIAKIAAHAGKAWVHPWLRIPLLRYSLRKSETFDLASGENSAYSICFDGTHVWIGLFTSPAKIIKMDPADGTYTVYTLASGDRAIYKSGQDHKDGPCRRDLHCVYFGERGGPCLGDLF
jgi:hypothetical protein